MKFSQCLLASCLLICAGTVFAQSEVIQNYDQLKNTQKAASDAELIKIHAKNYKIIAPGVAKDISTGLEWMRCSMGQSWDDKAQTCKGTINSYTHDEAIAIAEKLNSAGGYAGSTNWRVPTVRELQSLRYCSKGFQPQKAQFDFEEAEIQRRQGRRDLQDGGALVGYSCADGGYTPAINTSVFPTLKVIHSVDSSYILYWTSSEDVKSRYAEWWYVNFLNGHLGIEGDKIGSHHAVRLVR